MAHARKPGAPGKTKIPEDVVQKATGRLMKAFEETAPAIKADLEVIAQQHYLYLETVERPRDSVRGTIDSLFGKGRGPRRTPLGRMVWTGNPERWRLQLYKWSDECWDTRNEAGAVGGTPEECIVEATLGW